jgi:hypothetical protein
MRTLVQRFNAQNDLGGIIPTLSEREVIREFVSEHSGGLVVLVRDLGDNLLVKLHDSWGEDGPVVVHAYDPDDETVDHVEEFDDGHTAIARFLDITPAAINERH